MVATCGGGGARSVHAQGTGHGLIPRQGSCPVGRDGEKQLLPFHLEEKWFSALFFRFNFHYGEESSGVKSRESSKMFMTEDNPRENSPFLHSVFIQKKKITYNEFRMKQEFS